MIHLKHMALRVLLADESSTIKKVIQLALQDFGVEVKAVPVGLDVESVTRQFKPDLILADVLLVKKNGYEVAQDFKQNPELKMIPIILMWSGFIAFDQEKFIQSGAEDKIEKPFDAETLRQLVRRHVPKLQTNQIAPFLSYELPPFIEQPPNSQTSLPKIELPVTSQSVAPEHGHPDPLTIDTPVSISSNPLPPLPPLPDIPIASASPEEVPHPVTEPVQFQTDDLDDVDEFQQVPLPGRKKSVPSSEDWSLRKSFEASEPILAKSISIPDPFSLDVSDALIATMGEKDLTIPLVEIPDPAASNKSASTHKASSDTSLARPLPQNIDPIRLEEILREQVRDVLKEIAWRVVPDIAERVVREEMQRLLKEAERLP